MMYLGDFRAGQTVHFTWSTNNKNGASIAPTVGGTIRVYKNNTTGFSTAGVTDTRAFNALVGIHACTITLGDAFYAAGANYVAMLVGATVDGETVNAVLAHFSIDNRLSDAFMDKPDGIETGITVRQAWRGLIAAAFGKLSGAASNEVRIRNIADTKDRIVAPVDASGNRPGPITLDLT